MHGLGLWTTVMMGCLWRQKARKMAVPAAMAVARTTPFEANIDDDIMMSFFAMFFEVIGDDQRNGYGRD